MIDIERRGSPGRDPAVAQGEEVTAEARERARRVAEEQQGWLAAELESTARSLRNVRRDLEEQDQPLLGRMAAGAADGLEGASRALREDDVGGMLRRAESYARQHPMVFLGGAAACGLIAARFLKSSQERPRARSAGSEETAGESAPIPPSPEPAPATPPVFGPHGEVVGGMPPAPPPSEALYIPAEGEEVQ